MSEPNAFTAEFRVAVPTNNRAGIPVTGSNANVMSPLNPSNAMKLRSNEFDSASNTLT